MPDPRAAAHKKTRHIPIQPMPPSTQAQASERLECISFLFAISEFNYDPNVNVAPDRDIWGNLLPPGPEARAQWITDLTAQKVYRYRRWGPQWENQDITQAVGYWWWRQDNSSYGRIGGVDGTGKPTGIDPEPYSTRSICYLTKHMPILVAETDASLGFAYTPRTCGCELSHYPEDRRLMPWRALCFDDQGPQTMPGLSVLKPGVTGRRYAVGHSPAWIPALLPEAFRDNFAAHDSQGLTGDIATMIGLMALHSPRGNPKEVFESQRWENNRWTGPATAPRHVPRPQSETFPRGFLVEVALDNIYNPFMSTVDMLRHLEHLTPMVAG